MYALNPSIRYVFDRAADGFEPARDGVMAPGPRLRIITDVLAVLILVGAFGAYLAAGW